METIRDAGALNRNRSAGKSGAKFLASNLIVTGALGVIATIGRFCDLFGSPATSGRNRPPSVPLHEWYVGVEDEDET